MNQNSFSRLATVFLLGLASATCAFPASFAYSAVTTTFENVIHPFTTCNAGVICEDLFGTSHARAQAGYGALRVYTTASSGGVLNAASATADALASVDFQLFSASSTPIMMAVSMYYHFDILNSDARVQIRSCADCGPTAQIGVFDNPYIFFDNCPENRGLNSGVVDCAGAHTGILSASIEVPVSLQNGPVNTLAFYLGALTLSGVVDGFNTAYISSIVVPDGVTWQYPDLDGNPLNFRNQSTPQCLSPVRGPCSPSD